jgi:hypothetical protein
MPEYTDHGGIMSRPYGFSMREINLGVEQIDSTGMRWIPNQISDWQRERGTPHQYVSFAYTYVRPLLSRNTEIPGPWNWGLVVDFTTHTIQSRAHSGSIHFKNYLAECNEGRFEYYIEEYEDESYNLKFYRITQSPFLALLDEM